MFMGQFSHSIDTKGRLIIPAKFREQLGEVCIVTKGLDGNLLVYSMEEWQEIEESFRNVPKTSKAARTFTRFFFAGAGECECDKQGRILIPQHLREYAGLDKDVLLVGVMNKVEIWSKDRWDTNQADTDDMESIIEQMSEMGISI